MSRLVAFAAGAALGTLVGAYGAQNYEVQNLELPRAPSHCLALTRGPHWTRT